MSDFKEELHPRDKDGKFTDKNTDGQNKTEQNKTVRQKKFLLKRKMTPAQKIASVHIDFNKDNILPELNADTLEKMGLTENKNVLLKLNVIKRNLIKHADVDKKIMQDIITETLYNPIDVFPASGKNKDYYHLAQFVEIPNKNGLKIGLTLLDIDITKENFEIVHAYFVASQSFEKALKKSNKKY